MPVNIVRLQQLVGNPALYAEQQDNGAWFPVEEPLTRQVLQAHMAGHRTVGTYVLKGDQARTLVFDLDGVEQGDFTGVDAILAALGELGIPRRGCGVEWSGRKGYHVWVLFASYVPAKELRRLGRAVLAISGVECEVFPKQDKATKFGNLVKLPEGIHRVTGDRNRFVVGGIKQYTLPMQLSKQVLERTLKELPEEPDVRVSEGPPPVLDCLHKIQQGVTEGGRNHSLFHLAVMLRRGGVSEENLWLLLNHTAERCDPPLPADEVTTLLESSKQSGPVCSSLPKDVQCSECPVRRAKGLYCKPGQLRHGGEGELVVVQLGKRKAGRKTVELRHPDVADGVVALA